MAELLVESQELRVAYGHVQALDGLSVKIPTGAVGLLGPNGAGKSTLIKALLGFVEAQSGSLKLLGKDVVGDSLSSRALIGYMPEAQASFAELKTWGVVAYAAELAGLPRRAAVERAHESLSFVGVREERYRPVSSLSTGMQQRVKLAQALAHGPRVLLLDEPTNGLDPAGRADLLRLIKDIAERVGIDVLLSSHILPDIEAVCSYVAIVNKGRLVAAGAIKDLRVRERKRFELGVTGDEEEFLRRLAAAGGELVGRRHHNLLVALGDEEASQVILRAAVDSGVELHHLSPVERTLEEVFIRAVEAG